jgi:hypothetical protein
MKVLRSKAELNKVLLIRKNAIKNGIIASKNYKIIHTSITNTNFLSLGGTKK